ncbi:hypothetical protein SB49_06940 [Sediminicola sp. YIK13]|uniref:DUF2911 domain-containing protein n=1 Tax=Sediminicola sp. YIK13 TaxID=1453352 RepID=UPI00071F7B94|nr:DUF2911 domain-containing protein [Sediminicola sp. YIK13]ALM07565.1 hypothetical protein SB49_06940 [Sediminicola sp. YIK13]
MKALKWILIVVIVLVALFYFVGQPFLKEQTKKNSPEKIATFKEDGMEMTVNYSSPFKKDRIIFGDLVPYNVVWRTGANEPTTFTTSTDIKIMDKNLPAGTYSLWTKPSKDQWEIIFNKEVPAWGVTILSGGKDTTRNPEEDIVKVVVPTANITEVLESFTIDFEGKDPVLLTMAWDKTKVSIPINK